MIGYILFFSVLVGGRLFIFYLFPQQEQFIETKPATIFSQVKNHVIGTYHRSLPATEANLLSGIVFGDDMEKHEKEQFKKTGLLHVIAASGMNVSMLTSFILVSLAILFRRQYAIVLTAIAVICYVAMADFEPSIVRAGIMGVIALSAGLIGRQNTSILALIIAASGMILFDPEIITSISFILSFAATLGIIVLDPLMKLILKKPMFEDFRTSLAAQIATTPIILFFFGSYSLISLPANFLVLWTVPPLMALGFIGAVLSFAAPIIAPLVIILCLPLLAFFLTVAEVLSKFPLDITLSDLPWAIIVGYYLVLLAIVVRLYKIGKIKA